MWPSWEQTLLIFAATFMEGAIGFDFALLATPALGTLIGVRGAVVTLCLPGLGLALWKSLQGRPMPLPLRPLVPFFGSGALGSAVGVAILLYSPAGSLKWGVGLLILSFTAYSIFRIRIRRDLRNGILFPYLLGFLSGCLTGLAHAGGPLAVFFLGGFEPNRLRLARLVHVSILTFTAVQVAALSGSGVLDAEAAAQSAMSLLPALAGFFLGRLMRGRFSPALGYAAGLGLMAAAAISLVIFGPVGL